MVKPVQRGTKKRKEKKETIKNTVIAKSLVLVL